MDALILQKPSKVFQSRQWLPDVIPPDRLGFYIVAVAVVGLAVLGLAVTRIPLMQTEVLIALFLMIFMTEWAPIKLTGTPLQGSNLSVSAAIAFAALLVLGPAGSIVVNTGSGLAYSLKEKRPFYKRLLTTTALVCSSALAGAVYILAGGTSPLTLNTPNLVAAGLGAGAYFLANSALISAAISLQTGRPFRSVIATWQWLFLQMVTSLAVGLVMALELRSGIGATGFLLVSLLLILPWYSTYAYVGKSRQVVEQNERLKAANAGLAEAKKEVDLHVEELRALHNIGLSLNSARDLPAILQEILGSVVKLAKADACAIFLYDDGGSDPVIAGQMGLSEGYVQASEMALNGSARRALKEARPVVMDDKNYFPAMLSHPAVKEGIRAAACIPLVVNEEIVGGLDVSFKSSHTFSGDEMGLLRTMAEQAAVAIQNARLVEKIYESYLSTIRALTATVEAKDPYTRGHSEIVRQLAVATGKQLGLTPRQLQLLTIGALFHDIGKIGISEMILNKPNGLDDDEWPLMRQHPVIGERILSQVPALESVPTIVRHHHERFDGKGYPDGICAREDLLAAIVSVCDTYQAMTSDRPYRKAYSAMMALDEIRRCSGTQFVPEVVEAFSVALENENRIPSQLYRFDPALLLRRVRQ